MIDANKGDKNRMSFAVKQLKQLLLIKVIDANKMEQCLIFVRTKKDADILGDFLNKWSNSGGRKV